jgi:hypothetical protein
MNSTPIGIQIIMPDTGTRQEKTPPQPAHDDAASAQRQAPPPDGMGRLVDKTV